MICVNESDVARDPCESEVMSDHNLHANCCKKDFEICCASLLNFVTAIFIFLCCLILCFF